MSRTNLGLFSEESIRDFLISEGKGMGPKDMAVLVIGLENTIRETRKIITDGAAVREMDEGLSFLEKLRA